MYECRGIIITPITGIHHSIAATDMNFFTAPFFLTPTRTAPQDVRIWWKFMSCSVIRIRHMYPPMRRCFCTLLFIFLRSFFYKKQISSRIPPIEISSNSTIDGFPNPVLSEIFTNHLKVSGCAYPVFTLLSWLPWTGMKSSLFPFPILRSWDGIVGKRFV